MVYGHSTDYYDGHDSVELYSYAEFDGFDNDDKYRLMDIGARGSNRDGAALRYVADNLSKQPATVNSSYWFQMGNLPIPAIRYRCGGRSARH